MGGSASVVGGVIAGGLLAGVTVAALLPNLPASWRSPELVWVVAGGVLAGVTVLVARMTRPGG